MNGSTRSVSLRFNCLQSKSSGDSDHQCYIHPNITDSVTQSNGFLKKNPLLPQILSFILKFILEFLYLAFFFLSAQPMNVGFRPGYDIAAHQCVQFYPVATC